MKRYCQTLDLYDDKELIEAYVAEHAHVWEEVKAGIREVGIVDMQIYIYGNRLFMIMDTTDEFDMERDYARLATLPRQAEWEEHMSKYQKVLPGQSSQEKWKLMERISSFENPDVLIENLRGCRCRWEYTAWAICRATTVRITASSRALTVTSRARRNTTRRDGSISSTTGCWRFRHTTRHGRGLHSHFMRATHSRHTPFTM